MQTPLAALQEISGGVASFACVNGVNPSTTEQHREAAQKGVLAYSRGVAITMTEVAPVHVVIYARSIERLGAFYQAVLGLSLLERGTGFVALRGEGFELSVVGMRADAAARADVRSPPVPREATPIKVSFLVPSIEELRSVIERAGGVLNPVQARWEWRGQLHLDGLDPEGNVFQLRQRRA